MLEPFGAPDMSHWALLGGALVRLLHFSMGKGVSGPFKSPLVLGNTGAVFSTGGGFRHF